MKTRFIKYHLELIILLLGVASFLIKPFDSKYNRLIAGDGLGYYSYLPAAIIYNDYSFSFLPEIEKKYYESGSIMILTKNTNGTVNKYFPGMSILLLPFFLLAHLMSYIFNFEPDGYSILYQIGVTFAGLFYLWLGCKLLIKTLLYLGQSTFIVSITTVLILTGGYLVYNILFLPSLVHLYCFFLINLSCFIYCKLLQTRNNNYLFLLVVSLALLAITRPIDCIIVLLFPFFGLPQLKSLFKAPTPKQIALILLAGIILFIPLLLYKLQVDSFIVYSYGKEGFDFTNPEILNFLFSFRRGYFIYTPLAFIALLGFWPIFIKEKNKVKWILITYLLIIYCLSSWWCWWYGISYGQRSMADFYILNALLLAYGLQWLIKFPTLFRIALVVFSLTLPLNIIQAYQHYALMVPPDNINREIYLNTFLKTKTTPYDRLNKTVFLAIKNDSFNSNNTIVIDNKNPFSKAVEIPVNLHSNHKSKCIVTFMAELPKNYKKTLLVISALKNNEVVFWNGLNLKEFHFKSGKVNYLELALPSLNTYNKVSVYFWNQGSDEVITIHKLKVELFEELE